MAILYVGVDAVPERLRHAGPWSVDQVRRAAWLGPPDTWPTDEQLGPVETSVLDGLRFRVLRELPPLAALRRDPLPPWTVPVDLPGLRAVPVAPALGDGWVLRPDGSLCDRPGSQYARAAGALFDRLAGGEEVPPTDPSWWRLAFAALATTHRVTEDLVDAYGIMTTASIPRLAEAAWAVPKT